MFDLTSAWPEAIFFDCDGVLVDSESVAAGTLSAWAVARLGFSPTQARRFAERARGMPTQSLLTVSAVQRAAVGLVELVELDRRIDQVVRREARIIDGVRDTIADLPMPKAIVSNASLDWVVDVAARIGGPGLFSANLFSAPEVGRVKPYPDVYRYAADCLGVTPGHCVAVEDSVAGVTAARRAGIPVIGFIVRKERTHVAERLLRAGAVAIAQGMPSLGQQIRKLSNHRMSGFRP